MYNFYKTQNILTLYILKMIYYAFVYSLWLLELKFTQYPYEVPK